MWRLLAEEWVTNDKSKRFPPGDVFQLEAYSTLRLGEVNDHPIQDRASAVGAANSVQCQSS
ncbi:hypothetical protein T265_01903 [Opisthorchis viverrini]|uniref:Uncharacterized protein n=1 Tax=Opisthorchis viverrini TaxID=6198 RepID=A0A074ZY02_OPIVI|nr:hypothetical protein T265_01903 [Opisthorchis viverrini]KER31971.1 hypothetical protein T265_01903 [Opisthorchis viverrini]